MQDPNDDTQWNDVLRAKGIIPEKEKAITEDDVVNMLEQTIDSKIAGRGGKELSDMDLDELDELEDSEDEDIMTEYRRKRILEMKELACRSKFGKVLEISGPDYVQEVNKAGDNIWVVLHLYKQGIPHCALLNHYMNTLALKFPTTKFIKAISTTCVPNFPDKNLPGLFIYYQGDLIKQFIGSIDLRGPTIRIEEFEYLLGIVGAVPTEITEDPRPSVKDKLFNDLADSGDW